MAPGSAIAVCTTGGRVWHRRTRGDDLFTGTKCCALFVSGRCTTTIVVMVPVEKRCARCWGTYTPLGNTDEFGEGVSGTVGEIAAAPDDLDTKSEAMMSGSLRDVRTDI